MRNIIMNIEYDGSRYAGWQQPGRADSFNTISGKINAVLQRMTGEDILLNCALRTEAGVHAYRQTVNFKTESLFDADDFRSYLNRYLPMDIVVTDAQETSEDFHASLKAKDRTYIYQIVTGDVPAVFQRKYSWYSMLPLDAEAMRKACSLLCGRHDFLGFSSGKNKKSSVQTMYQAQLLGDGAFLTLELCSTNFLHNMARLIIGTLIEIGLGKREPEDISCIFSGEQKPSAPCDPRGLILKNVSYR